jgi:YidC/Oxa1 family membrane protein insertase
MNRNSIIGFVLIFAILIGYSYWTRPSEEEIAERRKEIARQDSIQRVEEQQRAAEAEKKAQSFQQEADQNAIIDSTKQIVSDSSLFQNQAIEGPFDIAKQGENEIITVETDKYKVRVSKRGGVISYAEVKNYVTYDTTPLILFDEYSQSFNLILNDNNVGSKDLYFEPIFKSGFKGNQDSLYLAEGENASIGMRMYPNDKEGNIDKNKYLEFEYIFTGDDYMIDFNMNMSRVNDVVAPGYSEILLYWDSWLRQQEKDGEQERKHTTLYYKYKDDKVDYLTETSDEDQEEVNTKLDWISFKQQFFASTLIAKEGFSHADLEQKVDQDLIPYNPKYLESMSTEIGIPLAGGELESFKMQWYFGPNKYNILKKYDLSLEEQIPLGWGFFLLAWINRFAVIPVFDFLSTFNWNYGIIILVLTLLLKLVLFPIAYKTYTSSAKMRVLKPEIEEIGKKFPKKEDGMKKQQATMALYKKAGVNPMAGCIPMLLQMPILIALFRFFPASIELRQQSFLWAEDLSSYDAILSWEPYIWGLSDVYGNHISLFTLLMTVSTIFYTKFNSEMMASNQQMPGMKTMMYIMPIMFLGFFNNYAAGLSYYYFLANMITFGQMFVIRKLINEDKIRAKINENKKKPVKKSGFQKRLEEAAKQRGVTPPKR